MMEPRKIRVDGTYPTSDTLCAEVQMVNIHGDDVSIAWLDYDQARRLYHELTLALGVCAHPHSDTMP